MNAYVFLIALALCCLGLFGTLPSGDRVTYTPSAVLAQAVKQSETFQTPSTMSARAVDYVVIIVMENKNYAAMIGNLTAAPYTNRLAHDFGLSTNYFDSSNNMSLPNYLGLTTGSGYDSWSKCNKPPSQCLGFRPISLSIVDRIETAGLTWKAYMEDMPSNCYANNSGKYVVRHNPFAYFSRTTDPGECNKVVPSGILASDLISDLSSMSTAANFMWLTPDLCNDTHNCSVLTGDSYLSHVIPKILNSTIFRTQHAALFLTWDEGTVGTIGRIPAIWAGPMVKNNYTSSVGYNHYSFLKTIETVWNLPSLTSNDAQAVPMTEFFTNRTVAFSYAPIRPLAGQSIRFSAIVSGGTAPYTFSWSFGDGNSATNPTVLHSYQTVGSYNISMTSTDAWAHSDTRSTIVRVSDFALKCNKQKLSLTTGASAVSTVTLHSVNGFEGNILLISDLKDASIYPSQITVPADGSGTATLTFSPKTSGTFVVTVRATYEGVTHMINQTYLVGRAVQQAPSIIGLEPTWFYLTATVAGVFVIVTGLFIQKSGRKRPSN